jgi:hypothetical protein
MAVTVATLAAVIAYWAVVLAVASVSDSRAVDGTTGGAIALGLFLLPVTFVLLAWISQNDELVRQAAFATALALIIFTWGPFIVGEPITPFAAAVGVGGAFAFGSEAEHRLSYRLVAVIVVTLYIYVIVRAAFGFALLVTPFFPLAGILAADFVSERRPR